MLLLDEMELTKEKLKGTPRPKTYRAKKKGEIKQAVVKHLSNLNKQNIDFAMFYIAKHSENFIVKDENGNEVRTQDVLKDWKKNMSDSLKSNEAMHLAFSIDEIKTTNNLEALENSVRDVLKHNFYENKFVYTIHKHQGKPHVHVIINKRSKLTNRKIHFKNKGDVKKFYKNLREEFAENLNHYNDSFNYRTEYVVERDLKYKLLKKTIDDLKKKMNLNSNIIEKAQNTIKNLNEELKDINNRIILNSNENITNIDENNHRKNLKKVKIILNRNKELTRIKKDIEKNIYKQEELIKNTEFIIKEAATKDFVDVEHTLKFFQSKMNKRNMTLSQYFGIEKMSDDFKEMKYFYNIKVNENIKNEKDEIQLLSMTTNAFKINKLYKQVIAREFENKNVLQDKDAAEKIKENKEFLINIFKEREHEVELMIRKTTNIIKRSDDGKLISKKENELSFLNKELEFINNIKDINKDLYRNEIDLEKTFDKFKDKIKSINKKTSIFQLQKIFIEKDYLKEKIKDKEKLEFIEKVNNKIIDLIDTRALQNYKLREFKKDKLKSSETIKDKTKVLNSLEFLKKENETIKKFYDKHITNIDRKVFISKLETKIDNIKKEDSIYKLIDLNKELKFRTKMQDNNEELKYLEQIKSKVKELVDKRAFRNFKSQSSLKEKYKEETVLEEKEKYNNHLAFSKQEGTAIKRVYKDLFTTKDKKELIKDLEDRSKYLNDTKSIYTIDNHYKESKFRKEFNATDNEDKLAIKSIKDDIKLISLLREDKVKRTITYYVDKLNTNITDKEIIETKKSLDYMKQENKDIKKIKQDRNKIKEKDIEIQI
ncbi:hypothetical protein CRU98_04555 [Arcobacter sp. CECT 8986]|uniref:relaxase/mobilization nuclease domain-containing protein n=1 Tax=Arcobacter sp. CECT 8986 TaxID=2044507 RepID=UPI001009C1B5|nr:hypothetical protein [Arcobacter sp. CECT 8986]RXK00433.1 hypothetical protein CRU98_04555 [Arcobacter sp. CECT 8986]